MTGQSSSFLDSRGPRQVVGGLWGTLSKRENLPLMALTVLVLYLYRDALGYAFLQGRVNPSQSHVPLVPFVSLWMAWMQRDRIRQALSGGGSAAGWLCLIPALLLHAVGILAEEARISLLSLIAALYGLSLLLGGWRLARILTVPILFLLFLIPYGHLEERISFLLRVLATRSGTAMASWAGVDVQLRGTLVGVSGCQLEIAAPCSGLRSLSSLLALAVVFAHVTEPHPLGKLLLILSAVPLAVIGNAIRLGLVLTAADSFGKDFGMKVHDVSGFLVFGFAFGCLMGIERLFECLRQRKDAGVSAS